MSVSGELQIHFYHSQRQSANIRVLCSSSKRFTSSSSSSGSSRLPVAIFVDLDNVAPQTQGRDDVAELVTPLRKFGKTVGAVQSFQGFANESTRTWTTEEERERREGALFEQAFEAWDGTAAQTGYDEDGVLRCGVCGARMKLSKKDRRNGVTEQDKLDKHMRMLHDREQEKRQTRMRNQRTKRGKKLKHNRLSQRDMEKFRKYEAAQVGLFRAPARRIKKNRGKPVPNDLFRLLKMYGLKVHTVHDVDSKLIKEARGWMKRRKKQSDLDLGHDHDIDALGCLVVVSEDADFAELLREARAMGFLTVSVPRLDSDEQTKDLASAADLVLVYGGRARDEDLFGDVKEALGVVPRATSDRGEEILMDIRMNLDEYNRDDDVGL